MQQRLISYSTVIFLILNAVLMATAFCEETESTLYSHPVTRFYVSESDIELSAITESSPDKDRGIYELNEDQNAIFESVPLIPAEVSVFYPTMGQSRFGYCWIGLRIDSNDNVYPINGSGFYRILSDGRLVNGVNDSNHFAFGNDSEWGELDEGGGKLYAVGSAVRSAPFSEGSEFSDLISIPGEGQVIVLGQGPLSGSLFFVEYTWPGPSKGVFRVTLDPLEVSVFADNSSFICPGAIAGSPYGDLYVVDHCDGPGTLIKITPQGVTSTFAIQTWVEPPPSCGDVDDWNAVGAVAVDNAGNVYWSHWYGVYKYDASGNLLGTLPGPPDKGAYCIPLGSYFDSAGNLYIVENWDCKKIYKYTFVDLNTPPVAICQNVTVPTEPGICRADASVDDDSFDPDEDEITLQQMPPGPYDLGDTDVILTVTDDNGASDTCEATVTVVDEEAPDITSVFAAPNVLWPPNHKMVPVILDVDALDNCDPELVCQIISVESNEPVNGLGVGNTASDWEITGDLTLKLRAERSGTGNGRVYTITAECVDASGNSSSGSAKVTVPHDKGNKKNGK